MMCQAKRNPLLSEHVSYERNSVTFSMICEINQNQQTKFFIRSGQTTLFSIEIPQIFATLCFVV